MYREALRINENAFGSEHDNVAQTLEKLATLLTRTGAAQEADSLEARARAIRETDQADDDSPDN